MKKNSGKTYSFFLNFGYAEDGMLGYIPFSSDKKFSSVKEAFIDLANFFKEAFDRKQHELKKCCQSSIKIEESNYCNKCGLYLKGIKFDKEIYIDFIKNIACADTNSYFGDIIDCDDNARWQPEFIGFNDVNIIYVAEKCLAAAIGLSPDDRVNIDSIFEKKSKNNSFSFWSL
jgi:hypothetical protein